MRLNVKSFHLCKQLVKEKAPFKSEEIEIKSTSLTPYYSQNAQRLSQTYGFVSSKGLFWKAKRPLLEGH